jgi:hypothetical protein
MGGGGGSCVSIFAESKGPRGGKVPTRLCEGVGESEFGQLERKLSTECWNFKQSMRTRNRLGIGLSYRSARLTKLAELVPWNRFLGFLKVEKFGLTLWLEPYIILRGD